MPGRAIIRNARFLNTSGRHELRTRNPEFTKRAPDMDFVEEVRSISDYSYEVKNFTGKGFLIVQDLVDCFWDFPMTFLLFVHQRYTKDIIDCFSGRIYGEYAQNLPGVNAMCKLLSTQREKSAAASLTH
jgi:hypothetical protein